MLALAPSTGACSAGSVASTKDHDGGSVEDGSAGGSDASGDAASPSCTTSVDCVSQIPPTIPAGCATGICIKGGVCEYVAKDEDGDGHPAANCRSTTGAPVKSGDDCNDHDPNLFPGHPEPCQALPDGGALNPGSVCAAGAVSCLADGTESVCLGVLVCAGQACVAGTCRGVCAPGQTMCGGNAVQTCTAQGTFGAPVPCASGTCVEASGVASCQAGTCTPGALGCNGAQPQQCNAAGTGWQSVGSPCTGITAACLEGACVSCTPGQTECAGTGALVTCEATGTWGTPVSCDGGACSGGACQ